MSQKSMQKVFRKRGLTVPSTADTANEMKILNIHFVNVKVTVDLDKGSCHGVVGMKV